jgi:SHS2 domain-containing protein
MQRYEFLSHVADIRLRVEAPGKADAFATAMEGMSQLLKHGFCHEGLVPAVTHQVNLKAPDITCLLIDFLSEVLSLSHIQQVIFCKAEFQSLTDKELRATVSGSPVPDFDTDIKAVTYHEANLHRNKGGQWETIIIFDI